MDDHIKGGENMEKIMKPNSRGSPFIKKKPFNEALKGLGWNLTHRFSNQPLGQK